MGAQAIETIAVTETDTARGSYLAALGLKEQRKVGITKTFLLQLKLGLLSILVGDLSAEIGVYVLLD